MTKHKNVLIVAIVICVIVGVGIVWRINTAQKATNATLKSDAAESNTPTTNTQTNELTPEEVIAQLEAQDYTYDEPSVSILSPDKEILKGRQVNLYQAAVTFPKTPQTYCACNWQFYLNQYDEETLWNEQETNCAENKCTFTHILDANGTLRLRVNLLRKYHNSDEVDILDYDEQNYIVGR